MSVLRRALFLSRLAHRYAEATVGIHYNPDAFGILASLAEGEMSVEQLAEQEHESNPYILQMVADLEWHGWVRREQEVPQGAMRTFAITEAGKAAVAAVRAAVGSLLHDRLGTLDQDQRERLLAADEALGIIIDRLG